MNLLQSFLWTVALVAVVVATPASATDWESVAESDAKHVFLNPDSIAPVGGMIKASAKENFQAPQPTGKKGKSFLSSRSTYHFDCAPRRVAIKSIKAYSDTELQGEVVQKAEWSDRNLQWMDAPAGTVFGVMLDRVCK
jgi:hypothetical protein